MTLSRRALILVGAGICCAVAVTTSTVLIASPAQATDGSVARVVDGDTVDVTIDDKTVRVRMLNIDTPETVDPSRPRECLGYEASTFTNTLLPVGTHVRLRFDEERRDRYDRTLAHVVLDDGRVVGEEIARRGLGVPVVVGANDARIASVRSAFAEAADQERGFFDPSEDCTVPAQLAKAQSSQTAVEGTDPGASVDSAQQAWEKASTSSRSLADARELVALASGSAPLSVVALREVGRGAEVDVLRRSLASVDEATTFLGQTLQDRRAKAAAAARAKAAAAARAKAAEARAEKRRAELARAAAADLAAQQEEDARQAQIAAEQARSGSRSRSRSAEPPTSSGGQDLSGYTGPRCYAPGGKSWKPC